MPESKNKLTSQQEKNARLEDKLSNLELELAEKNAQFEKSKEQLFQREVQFKDIQRKIKTITRARRKFIRFFRSIAAYSLGRRNIKQLYSKAYKRKKAENELKKYKYYLYNLGFTEKALADLERLYDNPNNRYQKRAAAWELVLWHANKYTKIGARQALTYLPAVIAGEDDKENLRKAAVIQAECHDILGDLEEGRRVLNETRRVRQHPDLYLAAANLEKTVKARTSLINKAMEAYNLQPIAFHSTDHLVTYDDLITEPIDRKIENGPKVSVILPAYNAETGISTAIESVLSQTWQHIELLVVDDCSADNTKDVVRDYMKKDSRITLLSTPVNSGPYIARNIALKAATGDYVTVNDADDWSHAEKIEIQANHLKTNKKVIANTSEHARLTEELKFYRRGTPGRYIFSNMSSLMFRRKSVLKKLGYWDSVRFAADGEFKRRLIRVFGKAAIVDLKTGPLSLPRQSAASLTGSSAFGYNGFFKGVRKEYVESFECFHQRTDSLVYPVQPVNRLFPIPEPMWPKREVKPSGNRQFDMVIAADFRLSTDKLASTIEEIRAHKTIGFRTGLVQMAEYNFNAAKTINPDIRKLLDGNSVQMLVYGETIACDILIVKNPSILQERQQYIPDIQAYVVRVVVEEPPKLAAKNRSNYDIRTCAHRLIAYFDKKGKWYPSNQAIRAVLEDDYNKSLRFIKLAHENWPNITVDGQALYKNFLDNWLVDENPYTAGFIKGDGYD